MYQQTSVASPPASQPLPLVSAAATPAQLARTGYAVLDALQAAVLCDTSAAALHALESSWDDLQPDHYLKDGGTYRKRRHACFVVDGDAVMQAPHRAHWQSRDYNALHGGMLRWFEPIEPAVIAQPAWTQMLQAMATQASLLHGARTWFIEAHQFRIDTAGGIGRPTPEGAHRDGVDLVAVFLVARHGIRGGETRVFDANGPDGQRFTLAQPWSLLLLDDARVIHESTPIQPDDDAADAHGWRDTLVLTCRAGAFQGDD